MEEAWVYRSNGDLKRRLTAALAFYHTQRGADEDPVRVTVNKGEVEQAVALLSETDVEVEGAGGCLITEVWLWTTEDEAAPETQATPEPEPPLTAQQAAFW